MKLRPTHFTRRAILLAPLFAALAGCMSSTPIWDKHAGEALRAVTAAQIIDPDAGGHRLPAVGVDGQSAVAAQENYDKSWRQPEPAPNAFVIGIGSGNGSGAAGQ